MPQKPILLLATGDDQLNEQIRKLDGYRISNAVTYLDVLPRIAKHGAPDIAIVSPFLPSEIDPPKAVEPLREQNTRVILLIGSLSPQELEQHYIPLAIYDLIPNPVTLQAIEHALTTPATLGEARQLLKKLPLLNSKSAPVIEKLPEPEEKRSSPISLWQKRRFKQETPQQTTKEEIIQPQPPQWLKEKQNQQAEAPHQEKAQKKPPIIILQKDSQQEKKHKTSLDWLVHEKPEQKQDSQQVEHEKAEASQELQEPKLAGWLDEPLEEQEDQQQIQPLQQEAGSQQQRSEVEEKQQEKEADTVNRGKSFGFTVLAGEKEVSQDDPKRLVEQPPSQQPSLIRFDNTSKKEEAQPAERKIIFLRGAETKPAQLASSTSYTIACFSPRPTGKSFVALNLAAQLARQAGPTTLIVPEGDLDIWERLQLPLQREQAVQIHGVPSLTVAMPHAARLTGQIYTVLDLPASFAVDELQPDWLVLVIEDMDAAHRAAVQQVAQQLRHKPHLTVLNQWQWNLLPKEFEVKYQMYADVIIPAYPSEPVAQLYGRPLVVSGQGGAEAGRAFTQLVDEVNRLLVAAQSSQ